MGYLRQVSSKDVRSHSCVRCGGMTVPELMVEDLQAAWGSRCVLCGDRQDSVIRANRAAQSLHEGQAFDRTRSRGLRRHGSPRPVGLAL